MERYLITSNELQEIMNYINDGWLCTHFKEESSLYLRLIRGTEEEKEYRFLKTLA